MIKTKSIYAPTGEDDGLRVLITRFYPRGIKREKYDIWVRVLAPSAELLRKYKDTNMEWSRYRESLLAELNSSMDSIEAIHTLQEYGRTQDVTLEVIHRPPSSVHEQKSRQFCVWALVVFDHLF